MWSPIKPNSIGEELWQKFLQDSKENKDNGSAYQCPWAKGNFVEVTDFSDMVKFEKHGAHVMLWCPAKDSDKMLDKYPLKYRITMQIRFDGMIGFAGGKVDEMVEFNPAGKNIKDLLTVVTRGLIREVEEEMMLKLEAEPKYVYSSCSDEQMKQCQNYNGKCIPGYVTHFFSCKVPIEALEYIEKNAYEIFSSREVLGLTRVPLYFMIENKRGLPRFMTNSFVANALEQLMKCCILEGLLTVEQVRFAYYVASTLLPSSSK